MYINTTGLPSVTDIIKPYIDTQWFLLEHQERGSAVHDAVAAHLNISPWIPPLPQEWQGYIDSAKRWIDLMVSKAIMVEKRLSDNSLKFCGQPDLIFYNKNGEVSLVDWKTSISVEKWWRLQHAGYKHLAEQSLMVLEYKIDKLYSVRLKKDGTMPLVANYESSNYQAWNLFIGALNNYHYFYC